MQALADDLQKEIRIPRHSHNIYTKEKPEYTSWALSARIAIRCWKNKVYIDDGDIEWQQFGMARRLIDALNAIGRSIKYSMMQRSLPARDSDKYRSARAVLNAAKCWGADLAIDMSAIAQENL